MAILGFTISFIIVLFKGDGFPEIILRPLASGIIMAAFWIAGYHLIKILVPEFMNEMESNFSSADDDISENKLSNDISGDLDFELENIENTPGSESGTTSKNETVKGEDLSESNSHSEDMPKNTIKSSNGKEAEVKKRAGSDEMLVQGVPIKKDPDLLARTIQHVLDTDKE